MKQDVYERITAKIIADLELGVRPWLKPWNAEHTAGRITRPLRSNGIPYRGINIVMLWMEAMEKGYSAPRAARGRRSAWHAHQRTNGVPSNAGKVARLSMIATFFALLNWQGRRARKMQEAGRVSARYSRRARF